MGIFTRRPVRVQPFFGYRNRERLVLVGRTQRSRPPEFEQAGRWRTFRVMMSQFFASEVRNVGVIELPVGEGPVALLLALDPAAARFPLELATRTIAGVAIPVLPFAPGDAAQALRAEHALREHGLPLPKPGESA